LKKIIAIDYGIKRIGIAETDEMQLIASGLTTVATPEIFDFLKNYFSQNLVEKIIIGNPVQMNGLPSESASLVEKFIEKLQQLYPEIPIEKIDERFTSKMAFQTMIDSGLKKKQRQNKGLIDEIAATILLQDYLRYRK
jgi:putative holliday junction resolvase